MDNEISVRVVPKGNGFLVEKHIYCDMTGEGTEREAVVEGKDPKKVGAAVLSMFTKTRGPRAKKSQGGPKGEAA